VSAGHNIETRSEIGEVQVVDAQTLALMKVLPEPTLLVTGNGVIVAANPSMLRLLADPAKAYPGQQLTEVVTDDPLQLDRYLQLCARSGQLVMGVLTLHTIEDVTEAFRSEGAVVRPWSPTRPALLLLRLKLRESAANRFILLDRQIAKMYREIHERQQAEAKLQEFNQMLEQMVAERTTELQNSNQELDQFAYVAAHDLKAPLRSISHLSQWIAEEAGDALSLKGKEYILKLESRVKRMDRLLDDLLLYARAGRQRHTTEEIDSAALVHNVADFLVLPPGFTISVEESLPRFHTERIPLETVFRNLLDNAIKHHDHPATGQVWVTAQIVDGWVKFAVSDNGPGIAPAFHQRILEIFTSLKSRDQVEGSGIGLAVVRKIVEMRGGNLTVESEEGQGATFHFTWRMVD
jgi:signal transduction histidine kinase